MFFMSFILAIINFWMTLSITSSCNTVSYPKLDPTLCFLHYSALSILVRLYFMLWMTGWRKHGIRDVFAGQLKRKGRDAVAVLHLDSKWTYGDLDEYSNRVGNYLLSKGYKPQTNVALFMENEPKYIAIWLGASKVGFCCHHSAMVPNPSYFSVIVEVPFDGLIKSTPFFVTVG